MNKGKKVMVGNALNFVDTDMIQIPVSAGIITQISLTLALGLSGRFIVSVNGVHTLINQFLEFSTKGFNKSYVYNFSTNLKESADLVCYFYTEAHSLADDIRIVNLSYQQILQ